jgi:poly-gamma-glutamate biosynthesis protein PgsC/CapC
MVIESLLIGLIIGIIFYEIWGLSPGGVITPGYFALFIHQPNRIFVTVIIALVVWGILELLSRNLILYGKRKFLLALLLGFCGKLIIESFIQPLAFVHIDLLSVGYIIPGLMANEMSRQNILKTLAATGIVSVVVYFILLLMH